MKIYKKLLSLLLVVVLLVGAVPVSTAAETTSPVTAETGDLGIEGTNSFGNLISDAVSDYEAEQGDDENSGNYSVTALEVSGNAATVTYDALEPATLVVAVYSEDGTQLITSGKTTVDPEETQTEVTIEGTMPEFFEVSAYLLDEQDLSPLCDAYTSPMYTQEMQQLLNSTIHDYDPELVLNLDEDESTNFAVYNPDVVIVEPVEGVNTVVSIDLENDIYVIENADEQITSLAAGTIFTYAYRDDEILIVKVESVSVSGTTATITGTETDIGEVFDCLKLETEGSAGDVIVDDSDISEGITYEGLVEEGKPATRAWEDDVTLKKKTLSFKISINVEEEGPSSVGASLAGDFKLTAYPKIEFYISMKRQHIEVTADLVGKLDASFKGVMKQEGLKLGKVTFPSPVGGITFSGEPKLVVQFDMTSQLSTVMTTTVGFGYDSSDGVLNLCTKPEIDMENSMEGSLFFGIEFEVSAEVISKNIASVGFTINNGVQITGKMTGTNHEPPPKENASKKHTCEDCLSLRFDRVREFSIWAKLIKYIKIEKTLKTDTLHLFDMYWSLVSDNPSTGFGKCPNYEYRVTVKVQDKAGNVAEGQEVFLKDGKSLGKTGDKGTLVAYLEAGDYVFQTTIGEEIVEVSREVSSATRVVLTNNPQILQLLAALDKLLIGSVEIKTHDTYLIGTFSSGVTWKLYRSGQMVIEGEGAMDHYSSFSKVPWCNYSDKIKEVEIKDGVTNVSSYAFSGCTNLKKVVLANSVKSIGNYAFRRCSGLLEIRLPVDYSYQAYSFEGCTNVQKIQYTCDEENVVMPHRYDSSGYNYYVRNSLEFICGDALKTVIFDEGITNVGNYAFYGAEGLENVYMAESITTIGSYSFQYSGIKKIELPEGLESIGYKAFYSSSLTEIWFPDSLETIGFQAFAYCYGLTELVIPDHMSSGVGNGAFLGCTGLKKVTLPVDYMLHYDGGSFKNCSSVESIHYTSGATGVMTNRNSYSAGSSSDSYENTLEYACRESLKTVTFDEGITQIGDYAYYGGSSHLEYVELPSTLQTIGSDAFYDTGLTNIELPEGLESIGYKAFYSSSLTEIWFPDSLETIGFQAFAYCYGLTELVIPDHMSSGVGNGAFLGCTGLKKVTLPVDYMLHYDGGSFKNCSSVEIIHYTPGATGVMKNRNSYSADSSPDSYENTLEYACRNSLKTVTFDEGITQIGDYAYYGGSSHLEYVELPSTLQTIGSDAFYDTGLTNIELPEGLESIGYKAFYSSSLTEIWFPDSLETIGFQAFAYCYGLTELVIPDHMSSGVGNGAFLGCTGLKKVTLPVDYTLHYDGGTFKNCSSVEIIHYTPGATGVMKNRNSYSADSSPDSYENTLEYACRRSLKTVTFDEGITQIGDYAYYGGSSNLEYVELPSTLQTVGRCAFYGSKLTSITFTGNAPTVSYNAFYNVTATAYYPSGNTTWTVDKLQSYGGNLTWTAMEMPAFSEDIQEKIPEKNIVKVSGFDTQSASKTEQTVQQTPEKPAQRSIFAGEYSAVELDNRIVQTARFSGLVAGEQYVMIAVLEVDTEDLLADSNLLAIRQGIAAEDGTLVFDYVQRVQSDVSYVFAAGPSGKYLEDAEIEFPIMTANGETQNIEPVVRYNGEVLTEEVDYILLGEVDYTTPGEYTCYIRGVREYSGLVECTYTVKELGIAGWNLTLGDQVGVNFYVTVGENLLDISEISLSVDGETEVYPINQGELDENTGSYRFTVPIAAAQMTQPVTVKLMVDGAEISSKTYTVRDYAQYILDDANGYDDSVKALVKALLNYGAASQNYFAYHVDNLANAGYESVAHNPIPADIPELYVEDELSGCGFYGASLRFYGELTVRFYFQISKNPDNFLIYQLRNQPQLQTKDGLYYVELTGICPQDLDDVLYLWVMDDTGYMMIEYSPMYYIARMYNKEETSESLKSLLQALYDYHLAAEAYCDSQS